jgi:BASS family bile acid:Na+ symporter
MPDAVVIFTGIVVFAQMFDVGLRVRPGSAGAFLRDTGLVLRSLVSVLIVVPLAVFVLIALIPLPPEVALGLVILAAAPGAPLTTRRAEAAGADRDYVSALQVMLAALAVMHMPLAFAAFDEMATLAIPPVAPEKIAVQVATVTFLPLALGLLFARAAPAVLQRREALLSLLSKLLFVAFLLAVVLAVAFVPDLRGKLMIGWAGAGAIVALAALALASGHALGGPREDRRAGLATATVARNLGLSLYVAERIPEMAAAIPAILTYALLAILLAAPYSRWMKGRLQAAQTVSPDRTG